MGGNGNRCPPRGRSPSWGAWIEILILTRTHFLQLSRSPSWGAWIEMAFFNLLLLPSLSRSPSWGAWIEIED